MESKRVNPGQGLIKLGYIKAGGDTELLERAPEDQPSEQHASAKHFARIYRDAETKVSANSRVRSLRAEFPDCARKGRFRSLERKDAFFVRNSSSSRKLRQFPHVMVARTRAMLDAEIPASIHLRKMFKT